MSAAAETKAASMDINGIKLEPFLSELPSSLCDVSVDKVVLSVSF